MHSRSAKLLLLAAVGALSTASCGSSNAPPSAATGGAPNTDDGGTGGTPAAGGGGSSSLGGSAGSAGSGAGVLESGAPIDADSVPALNPVATYGQLKVVGTELEDQNGQAVQLKGVSSQWLNYETMMFPESKPAIQYARDHWKLSVIRAAMGIDAAGGYLGTGTGANAAMATMQTKVETIVQNAIDLGIYVIVDWHTSNAVTATTTQTTQATAFFSALAQKFGSVPNIIYEPYNEPNRVTWAQIKPYHESVVAAIRAVDPDNLIVLGTPTFSQDVDLAALDPVAGTNLLYTLHFYACTHQQALRDKATLALSRGIALFVTEFGATPADGGLARDPFVCEDATNAWFSWMGDHHISGVSWKLDRCTATSCDTSNILTADAPVDGPWTDNFLTNDSNATPVDGGVRPASGGGHGQFVVNWLRQ